jgi:hypothetical protein
MEGRQQVSPVQLVVGWAFSAVVTAAVLVLGARLVGLDLGLGTAMVASLTLAGCIPLVYGLAEAVKVRSSCLAALVAGGLSIVALKLILGIPWGSAAIIWLFSAGIDLVVWLILAVMAAVGAKHSQPPIKPDVQGGQQEG